MVDSYVLVTGGRGDIGKSIVDRILKTTEHNLLVTTTSKGESTEFNSDRVELIQMDASITESISAASENIAEYPVSHFIQLHGTRGRMTG